LKPTLIFETLEARRSVEESEGSTYYDKMESLLKSLGYQLFSLSDGQFSPTSIRDTSEDTLAVHMDNEKHFEIVSKKCEA
jgi:hypothetical protein